MDDATKQAALTAVLLFNMIVIVWMLVGFMMSRVPPTYGVWITRAVPAVFVAGGVAGATFYFMKPK